MAEPTIPRCPAIYILESFFNVEGVELVEEVDATK